jgi:hypothetical protein
MRDFSSTAIRVREKSSLSTFFSPELFDMCSDAQRVKIFIRWKNSVCIRIIMKSTPETSSLSFRSHILPHTHQKSVLLSRFLTMSFDRKCAKCSIFFALDSFYFVPAELNGDNLWKVESWSQHWVNMWWKVSFYVVKGER